MGFRFRFETLSRVRKIREDLALQEFSKAQRQVLDLEKFKDSINIRMSGTYRNLTSRMGKGIKSQEIIMYNQYIYYLEAGIKQVDKQIALAMKRLEAKRQELLKAKQESQAIERLREIDMERYKTEQDRLEMRFIDEIAVQRHGRIV